MTKSDMIKVIQDARYSDADFFYCIINVAEINDLTEKALNKMSKKELRMHYDTAKEILIAQARECGEVPMEFKD